MALVSPALLSVVIADLYDAALEPSLWMRALPSIASIFDSQQLVALLKSARALVSSSGH